MYCAHEAHVYRQENAKKKQKMILKKNLRSTFLNIGKYPNLKVKVKRIFFFGLRMLGRSDG